VDLSESQFFSAKALEAESRAAAALTPGQKEIWLELAQHYRRHAAASLHTANLTNDALPSEKQSR
jgi:hypothetical protein